MLSQLSFFIITCLSSLSLASQVNPFLVTINNRTLVNEMQTFPNIGYVGMGYDMLNGNPHPKFGTDPGFKVRSVYQYTYNQGRVTADLKYKVPDGISVIPAQSCSYVSVATEIKGEQSYSEELKVSAKESVSAGFGKFSGSFSASQDYQRISSNTNTHHEVVFSSRATCTQFSAVVEKFLPPVLSADFRAGILYILDSTGLKIDQTRAIDLLVAYGTHFVQETFMGSQAVFESTFTSDSYNSLKDEKFDISFGCTASFGIYSGSASVSTEVEKKAAQKFDSNRKNVVQNFVGSAPTTDGKWETWASQSNQSPFPIQYELTTLAALITAKNFPEISNPASIANQLQSVIQNWCVINHVDCSPKPDPTVPRSIVEVVSSVLKGKSMTQLQCPINTIPISLGFERSDTGSRDFSPSYYIDEKLVGNCANPYDMTCRLRCVSLTRDDVKIVVQDQSSDYGRGVAIAVCPTDYYVTNCGAKQSFDHIESWPYSFPVDQGPEFIDANHCRAYNYYGVSVSATCIKASKVKNYHVSEVYGSGSFYAKCKVGTSVLGCGYNPDKKLSADEFYSVDFDKEMNGCKAYNHYGATVYAMCGTISY